MRVFDVMRIKFFLYPSTETSHTFKGIYSQGDEHHTVASYVVCARENQSCGHIDIF